tara:strand:- start:335 stop:706 length:372 start_codon:yes stop_codon:yes gene_type:complete
MSNTPKVLYDILKDGEVADLVTDISPYVRDRNADFPALIYEVPNETFERTSSGYVRSQADATVSVVARGAAEAETIADALFDDLSTAACVVVDSITREYDQSYDGSSAGIYQVMLNIIITQGA